MTKKICFIAPSLPSGGAERVLSTLANEFAKRDDCEVHFILFLEKLINFDLNPKIKIHSPKVQTSNRKRAFLAIESMRFIRKELKKNKIDIALCFGGRYNSFFLISMIGLKVKAYISDRSKPGIKYGFVQDFLNPMIYKRSTGIIAQTRLAKELTEKFTQHPNVRIIPNPVDNLYDENVAKEKVILNIGRFVESKQQHILIDVFMGLNPEGWTLEFVGDGGEYFEKCKRIVEEKKYSHKIKFLGNRKNVKEYYQKSKIFAFTSKSEGFPNALLEAMSAGCAIVSFDCVAGPSDLINDGKNGYLVPQNDLVLYKHRLDELLKSETLINNFSANALREVKRYYKEDIAKQYYEFLTDRF